MAENKKAKFFCESCGSEVAAKARFCPKCGKFFAAVRCPECGHSGSVTDFKKGCPNCHYAMKKSDIYGEDAEETQIETNESNKKKLSAKNKKAIRKAFNTYNANKKHNDDVPGWMFILCIILLIILSGLIFYRCH